MEEKFPVHLYCRFWLHINRNMGGYPDVCLLGIGNLICLNINSIAQTTRARLDRWRYRWLDLGVPYRRVWIPARFPQSR